MDANYPHPVFHFMVDFKGSRMAFTEVSGLNQETQVIEYRDGTFPEYSTVKMPGLRKYDPVTLKRALVTGDNELFEWFTTVNRLRKVERRDLTISLLDETHKPVMTWKLHNAFPGKIEGAQLKATGNEVAIESVVVHHEGAELIKADDK